MTSFDWVSITLPVNTNLHQLKLELTKRNLNKLIKLFGDSFN